MAELAKCTDGARRLPWEEHGFFQAAVEAHEDAFWVVDPARRELVFANAALEHVWGLRRDELGSDFRQLLARVPREERRSVLAALSAGWANGSFDLRATLQDGYGRARLARIHGSLELRPAVAGSAGRSPLFVGWIQDLSGESALRELVEKYRTAAETDPLTGVANRRGLQVRMSRALALSAVGCCESSAIMIDLDDFKAVNDVHGYHIGDRVLEIAARRLESGLRSADLLGRIGGDEFLVVLPSTGAQAGFEIAQRMRRALHEAHVQVDGRAVPIRASFAVTHLAPKSAAGIDDVLRLVRHLMSEVKSQGKDGVASAYEGMTNRFGFGDRVERMSS